MCGSCDTFGGACRHLAGNRCLRPPWDAPCLPAVAKLGSVVLRMQREKHTMDKKAPLSDPRLFDYSPRLPREKDADDEIHQSMYEMGVKPEELPDPKDRRRYERWLKKHGHA